MNGFHNAIGCLLTQELGRIGQPLPPTKLQEIDNKLILCRQRRKAAIMKVAKLMGDEA